MYSARRKFLPGAAVAAALLVACGENGPTGPEDAWTVDETGGTIVAYDGNVQLTFPQGAVTAKTAITVAVAKDPPPSEGLLAKTAYKFGPEGLTFSKPVQLSLKYSREMLPAKAPQGALAVHKLVNGKWIVVEGSTVDTIQLTVHAPIHSLATYALAVHDPCHTAPAIQVGQTVQGELAASDCQLSGGERIDYYTLPLAEQSMFRLTFSSLNYRPVVSVYTASGSFVVAYSADAVGADEAFQMILPGGTYQIRVRTFNSGELGPYTIASTAVSEVTCGPPWTHAMPGISTTQQVTSADCSHQFNGETFYRDDYYFYLTAAQAYSFSANASFGAVLEILNTANEWVAGPVYDPGGKPALTYTPSANGYYRLSIVPSPARTTGSYSLTAH